MTVRPISFQAPMIRALLDGRKTQTRRLKFKAEPGDLLWVKETWADASPNGIRYVATDDIHELRRQRPSIYMPRWASRLTLEVTEVRQERLLEITDADAQREGIYDRHAVGDYPTTALWTWDANTPRFAQPWQAFAELWDSINSERTGAAWVSNPLVTVISFRVHRCNVDDSSRAGDQEDGGASPRPDGDHMRRSADE